MYPRTFSCPILYRLVGGAAITLVLLATLSPSLGVAPTPALGPQFDPNGLTLASALGPHFDPNGLAPTLALGPQFDPNGFAPASDARVA